MKKFMFSAVALVAFSFAGMANTGDEKIDCLDESINLANTMESLNNYFSPTPMSETSYTYLLNDIIAALCYNRGTVNIEITTG